MSGAILNIAVTSKMHAFLIEHGSEVEGWSNLNEVALSGRRFDTGYNNYLLTYDVNYRFDREVLYWKIKEFVENHPENHKLNTDVEDDCFMDDLLGMHFLTDHGDYTNLEGNFAMDWSGYTEIYALEHADGVHTIVELNELFKSTYGLGSLTLDSSKLLLNWLNQKESLVDCFEEIVSRCMTTEMARLSPSQRKKRYPNEVLEVSERAFKGSVIRLQREFKKETGGELKSGKANQMLAKIVYDKSAPEAKAIIRAAG